MRLGLAPARPESRTVAGFLDEWLDARSDYKPESRRAWAQVIDALKRQIGDRPISKITATDAEAFRRSMMDADYRPTTVHKRLGHARQMFADAVRKGLIDSNPFEHVRHRAGDPAERRAQISAADAMKLIDEAPNAPWRLLIVLARFGGLRVPSEPLSLRWQHVDWERNRLIVPTPKLEHLPGRSFRVMPLFPIVREYLAEMFELAPDGAEYVFPDDWRRRAQGSNGWGGANFRSVLAKIARRAGLTPWPRLWHSLRASCESDLAASFPLPAVTKWLGNTPTVAMRHYIDPTDELFDKAANWSPASAAKSAAQAQQKTKQQENAQACFEMQFSPEVLKPLDDMHAAAQTVIPTQIQKAGVYGNRTH